jgi:cell division protein FtsW
MSRKPILKKNTNSKKHSPDLYILIFAIALSIFGAVMIYDASVYIAHTDFGDKFYFLKSQIVWLVIGTIVAIPFYFVNYKILIKLSIPAMGLIILSLIAVLFLGEKILMVQKDGFR